MSGDPSVLFSEAMEALNRSDFETARGHLEALDQMAPNNPGVLSFLGFAEASMGLDTGLAKTQKAVELAKENPQILMNYAFALGQAGQADKALPIIEKANTLAPGQANILYQLVRLLLASDRANDAMALLEANEKHFPTGVFLLEQKAIVARASQDWPASYKHYKALVDAKPDNISFKRGLAHSLIGLEDFSNLVPVLKEIRDLDPENDQVIYSMAYALFNDHRHEECMPFVEKVLERDPNNIDTLIIKGRCLTFFGDLEGAEALFKRVLELEPGQPMAVMQLAKIKLPKERDESFDELEAMEEAAAPGGEYKAFMGHTLGEMYEGIGDYDKAFHYFQRGNGFAKERFEGRGFVFDQAEAKAQFEEIKNLYSQEALARLKDKGSDDTTPIFIVAMPRSGTTLLEQVISAHSQVYGAGELPLGNAVEEKFLEDLGDRIPEALETRLGNKVQDYAHLYLDFLPERAPEEKRVSDKMPHNFQRLGFLQTVLPNASYIWIRRNPLDVCLSIYKGFFAAGFPYAVDLENLGYYYRLYEELMAHWQKALPQPLLEVQYEAFVASPDIEAKKVLEHCNLEWEEGCLEFHKTRKKVITMSTLQVREPVHKKAIDKWRRYEKHLDPLLKGLGEDIVKTLDI